MIAASAELGAINCLPPPKPEKTSVAPCKSCKTNFCNPCDSSPYCGPNCLPAPYCYELNLRGDFLYWLGQLGGLESAFGKTTISTTVTPGRTTTTVTEVDQEPTFQWKPGFRVGADVTFNCFDLEGDWTHFIGKAHFNQAGQSGHWYVKYDAIDLFLGRRCCVASCIYFKPFIGVRGVEIRQSLKTNLDVFYTALIGNNTVLTNMEDREKIWGIGPELGVEGDWYLGKGFNFYVSFDVVSYYGTFKGTYFDTDIFTITTSNNNSTIRHHFNTIGTDIALGFRWDYAWPIASEGLFSLKLGAEQHRIYDMSNLGTDGTLSLDGPTLGASFGYRW
ncbi:MAG TPA: Lpg1974 family pore-forming outer membrane protein [Rhabdochlamydiaceae bacterium]|nr:Lpg1974 family pore-forming outer membrane protein [Rhabdochlamydiaceae bacterium]